MAHTAIHHHYSSVPSTRSLCMDVRETTTDKAGQHKGHIPMNIMMLTCILNWYRSRAPESRNEAASVDPKSTTCTSTTAGSPYPAPHCTARTFRGGVSSREKQETNDEKELHDAERRENVRRCGEVCPGSFRRGRAIVSGADWQERGCLAHGTIR